ncbi:hypothetical protein AB4876_08540 [Zhongshania guokunii]|uniref:DoxX family protein n=1 Tax=Zhongshania guokunii TaxID=641783 RepID=A0ABV3U4S9_9GAMM
MLKFILRSLVCVVFLLGGLGHFFFASEFAAIVPPLLPWPMLIVWFTGVVELLIVVGMLWPKPRVLAGRLAAIYCVLVLPANIYQGLSVDPSSGVAMGPEYLWWRIPLQFVLIAAILWSTNDNAETLIHARSSDV